VSLSDERVRSLDLEAPRNPLLERAYLILQYTHDSARALLEALRKVREERRAGRGALTDEEQDLLRAMLVMAASGLDAMTKEILRSVLPPLCKKDEEVKSSFQKFVERKLKGDGREKFLSLILTAENVQESLIEQYVDELTGNSLQSVDALYKAVNALGLFEVFDQENVRSDDLQRVFRERNRIVHELDIDFTAPRRNRRSRRIGHTIQDTNRLLMVAERIYKKCKEKLEELEDTQ